MVNSDQYPMASDQYDDEIDLVELLVVIWKYRRLVFGLAVFFAITAAIMGLSKNRTYTASTTIINMMDSKIARNIDGIDFQTLIQAPRNSILQAILNSHALACNVVSHNELLPVLFPKKWNETTKTWDKETGKPSETMAVKQLKRMITISANDRNSTITISATTDDPGLSARIANAYTSELDEYLKTNTFSSVQRSKAFLEQQLEESRKTLDDMVRKMETFQSENDIFDFENQTETSITAYKQHALLLEKYQTEARMTESISSPSNPKVLNLKKHIATIEHRMNQLRTGLGLEEGASRDTLSDGIPGQDPSHFIPLDRITEFKVMLNTLNHDIKNQQKVHDLLLDAYEKITIQDAKEKIFVTVLDKAEVPLKPNGRGTVIKVILGFCIGGFLGIVVCFINEFYQNHIKHRINEREAVDKNAQNSVSYFLKRDHEKHLAAELRDVKSEKIALRHE